MKNYDITKTKLIIWDLDDTFWKGTLSEGGVEFLPEMISFIEELTLKGIMNSICSKNDFESVKNEFINKGFKRVWDLFIFPSINWLPKGERVKNIINDMNLRAENVILIDDNISNLNEAKFYSPEIMTAHPDEIKKISEELYLVNDYDFEHTRLKQYKILEEKSAARGESSNEEFLRACGIKICIKHDCLENIERLKKLISRTNQLNFTKFRDENLEETIKNNESGYVIAEDKFGNYGICGFYVLGGNKLIHFLFSCRIMNMGIEQFLYNFLGKPELNIQGEVASNLEGNPDWIEVVDNLEVKKTEKPQKSDINILFKGPCDLYSVLSYIKTDFNIDTEFPYWNKKLIYILAHTHTAFIEQTHKFSAEKINQLTSRFPFPSPDEFKTKFFDPKYKLIFLSLLTTTHSGLYINKEDGSYVLFGFADCDITDENNWEKILAPLPPEAREPNIIMLREFKENYTFAGNPPVETVIKNLDYIRKNLSPETKLVLILGSEVPTTKVQAGYENMAERHKIMNQSVRKWCAANNAQAIELTDFIKSDEDYTTCINHFSREVYANLAGEVQNIINKTFCDNIKL